MKHIVSFSGGIGSWAAAKRVADKHGTDDLYLVFCDTLSEDPDLHRFIDEAASNIGGTLIKLSDGRDIYDVFADKQFIGNAKNAPCSAELKIKLFYKWIRENFNRDEVVIYMGFDFTESHRLDSARESNYGKGYKIEAPLCEAPYLLRHEVFKWLEREGIKMPKLYELGFTHNNCSGACVKAGTAQFKLLYEKLPEVYQRFERRQEKLLKEFPEITPPLKKNGKSISMKEFRESYLEKNAEIDRFDIGGCGCFVT